MSVYGKQNSDGSYGLPSTTLQDEGGFLTINIPYVAGSVDNVHHVALRPYRVKAISGRVEVAGTDGGAVTSAIKKAASGTAITAGTALHSGTFNLKGTAATNQSLTLSTTDTDLSIAVGDSIGMDFTGTLTDASGVLTVLLAPA